MTPIKVRKKFNRFQIVYGHRRVRATKLLGQTAIRADVVSLNEEEMLDQSLVENLFRRNLSDYEVAKCFARMNKEFHKSYEEIAKVSGFSKSHVGNFCRMLQLFDEETLARNPDLEKELKCISEHHARILLRITDASGRASALRLTLSENLSVRELERTVLKLRAWFDQRKNSARDGPNLLTNKMSRYTSANQESRRKDIAQIQNCLNTIFNLPHKGNFEDFAHLHAFESGFSIYSFFPPLQLLREQHAPRKGAGLVLCRGQKLTGKYRRLEHSIFQQRGSSDIMREVPRQF